MKQREELEDESYALANILNLNQAKDDDRLSN